MAIQTRRAKAKSAPSGALAEAIDLSDLTDMLGYALRRATSAAYLDFVATFRAARFRPTQYSILTVVARNPGRTQSAIAAALDLKRANFVVLLDELEARNLVRRAPAEGDRRSHALYLTEKGKRQIRALRALNRRHEAHLTRRLGAEGRRRLLELLARLRG